MGMQGGSGARLLQGSPGHCLRDSWWGWAIAKTDPEFSVQWEWCVLTLSPKGHLITNLSLSERGHCSDAKAASAKACLAGCGGVSEGTGLGQAPLPLG